MCMVSLIVMGMAFMGIEMIPTYLPVETRVPAGITALNSSNTLLLNLV